MSEMWDQMVNVVDKTLMRVLRPIERWKNIHDALYVLSPIIAAVIIGGVVNVALTIWR